MTHREMGYRGGSATSPRKKISSARNAEKARLAQLARNGALFGKKSPALIAAEEIDAKPHRDLSLYRQAED